MNKRGIGVVAAIVVAIGVLVLGMAALGTGDIALGPRSQGITCSDVNNDRVLDIADVIMIGEIVQNNVRLNGDCDGDKDTDFDDATALAEYLFTTSTQEKIQKDIETKLSPAIALGPAGALPSCTPALLPQYGDGTSTGFLRGDANEDGMLDVADAVVSLWALFVPGTDPLLCTMLGDTNGVNGFDVSDAIYTLAYIFIPGSPAPAAPFPSLGFEQSNWIRTYGGPDDEYAESIIEIDDGYIFLGGAESFTPGFNDIYVVKIDGSGNEVGTVLLGNSSLRSYGHSIAPASDGGYIITGQECNGPCGGSNDFLVIKLDADLNQEWEYSILGFGSKIPHAAIQTNDGGYIVAGYIGLIGLSTQGYLVKLSSAGVEEWNMNYGGPDSDNFRDIMQTSDGGFIVSGSTRSFGTALQSGYVVKTNALGVEEWSNDYVLFDIAGFKSGIETSDGGYIFTGFSRNETVTPNNQDVYVVKTDSGGGVEWERKYGDPITTGSDGGESIIQIADGSYVIAGKYANPFVSDALLLKIDGLGNEQWLRNFDFFDDGDSAKSVRQTSDGGFILAGSAQNEMVVPIDIQAFVIKTNSEGLVI